jgi:hypothetical protein
MGGLRSAFGEGGARGNPAPARLYMKDGISGASTCEI